MSSDQLPPMRLSVNNKKLNMLCMNNIDLLHHYICYCGQLLFVAVNFKSLI